MHHVQKSTLGPTAPCSTVQFIKNTSPSCLLITRPHELIKRGLLRWRSHEKDKPVFHTLESENPTFLTQIKAGGGRNRCQKTFLPHFLHCPCHYLIPTHLSITITTFSLTVNSFHPSTLYIYSVCHPGHTPHTYMV